MDSPLLPEDILLDIFSRLPVNHVLRLRSLSHHLRRSLSTPHFARLHLRHQLRRRRLAIFESREPPSSVAFRCVHTEAHSDQPVISWGDSFKYSYPNARIWNSCDGLILFSISDKSFFAFNPSTRDRQLLRHIPPLCRSEDRKYSLLLGLGFDALVDEYKVAGAVVYWGDYRDDSFVFCSSLNNSRLINKRFEYAVAVEYSPGTSVNGVLYWLVERHAGDWGFEARPPPVIVYFDFAANVFVEMAAQLPYEPDVYEYDLVVLRGSLCVVCHRGLQGEGWGLQVEVWELGKCGDMDVWVRLFVVINGESLVFRTLKPLCFTEEGEVIMAVDRKRLVVYNLKERTHRLLFCHPEVKQIWGKPDGFEVAVYVESLVSPRSASEGYGAITEHSSTGTSGASLFSISLFLFGLRLIYVLVFIAYVMGFACLLCGIGTFTNSLACGSKPTTKKIASPKP
ncbi:hypothetical protein RHSIM_Rhsim04G0208900 [Rhododendron simsii]|uniref:F-box domain-containing protein n=1 Tax=Rhododendron simsii TaxID=118357 RepID=A0A834LQR1_RHOSS|nr:hypothetical protein RHSIM_Rhsim04G0208900 [Rhododendron simsii]